MIEMDPSDAVSIFDIASRKRLDDNPYVCTVIDGRAVNKTKRHPGIWSRNELAKECERFHHKIPKGMRKQEYAKVLILLRGLHKLEHIVANKLYCLSSPTCSICKENLIAPVFRHSSGTGSDKRTIGYHVLCIQQWMLVSHKFSDPITRKAYTDKELQKLDSLGHAYDLPSDLLALRWDEDRVVEDRALRDLNEQIEVVENIVHSQYDSLRNAIAFHPHTAPLLFRQIEQSLRELCRLNVDSAKELINTFISGVHNEKLFNFLVHASAQVELWSEEPHPLEFFEVQDLDLSHFIRIIHGTYG